MRFCKCPRSQRWITELDNGIPGSMHKSPLLSVSPISFLLKGIGGLLVRSINILIYQLFDNKRLCISINYQATDHLARLRLLPGPTVDSVSHRQFKSVRYVLSHSTGALPRIKADFKCSQSRNRGRSSHSSRYLQSEALGKL